MLTQLFYQSINQPLMDTTVVDVRIITIVNVFISTGDQGYSTYGGISVWWFGIGSDTGGTWGWSKLPQESGTALMYIIWLIYSTCFTGCMHIFLLSSLFYHHWWQQVKKAMTPLLNFFWRQMQTKMLLIQCVGDYVCIYLVVNCISWTITLKSISCTQEGYTALHFAALKQHADVVKCLLDGNSPHPDFLAQVCKLYDYLM